MATLECAKCGARFGLTRTGLSKFTTTLGASFAINCHVLMERMKETGSTSEHDCPHIDEAMQYAINSGRVIVNVTRVFVSI